MIDQPFQSLDAGGGFRAWGFSTELTLNGRLLPTVSVSRSASWADPLLAARYHRDFRDGFGLTVYGDFGGFDVGAHVDWQLIGTLDYALRPWATLRLGYRSLNFNYQGGDNVGFNVHMKGPIIAASFRILSARAALDHRSRPVPCPADPDRAAPPAPVGRRRATVADRRCRGAGGARLAGDHCRIRNPNSN